jgi:hypothetical protein
LRRVVHCGIGPFPHENPLLLIILIFELPDC